MSIFEWAMLFIIIGVLYFVSIGKLSLPIHWEDDYSKIVLLIAILFLYNNISLILIVFLLLTMIYMKSTPEQKAKFFQSLQFLLKTPPNQWLTSTEQFINHTDLQGFIHDISNTQIQEPEPVKAEPALYSMESEENVDDVALKKRLDDIFDKLNH